jgi:hypothetical protein
MQVLFTLVGMLCLGIAVYFAVMTESKPVEKAGQPSASRQESHPANWGAAEGFAIAGGLCFIAAGLVHRAEGATLREPKANDERAGQQDLRVRLRD